MNEKLCIIPLFLIPIFFGISFGLTLPHFIIALLVYLAFTPTILRNRKLQKHEFKRFQDLNLYMSQISQSFVRTKNILFSLKETADIFPSGEMKDKISEAIDILLSGNHELSISEEKSFSHFEETYGCEKLRTLHEFLQFAEDRGGECGEEFIILEKSRIAWETALGDYRKQLISHRNMCSLLYLLMLGVCLFLLHAFPDELRITHLSFVQITNTILLSMYIVFFVLMDCKVNGQLFKSSTPYNPHASKHARKREIENAFPKWLFDILLLSQRQSIDSAIIQSVSAAPIILQPELSRISTLLLNSPGNMDAYTSFLSEYQIPKIATTMRKLYALSIGAENHPETIHFLIESNMDSLIEAERNAYKTRSFLSSLYPFFPMLIVTLGMLVYCVAIIHVTLSQILSLFE